MSLGKAGAEGGALSLIHIFLVAGFIGIGNAVVHHPKAQFRQFIVGAGPLPEPARLHIALALPCPEKNIPSPAPDVYKRQSQ